MMKATIYAVTLREAMVCNSKVVYIHKVSQCASTIYTNGVLEVLYILTDPNGTPFHSHISIESKLKEES